MCVLPLASQTLWLTGHDVIIAVASQTLWLTGNDVSIAVASQTLRLTGHDVSIALASQTLWLTGHDVSIQGWASVLIKRTFQSLRSFPFFYKERSDLCVLFCTL